MGGRQETGGLEFDSPPSPPPQPTGRNAAARKLRLPRFTCSVSVVLIRARSPPIGVKRMASLTCLPAASMFSSWPAPARSHSALTAIGQRGSRRPLHRRHPHCTAPSDRWACDSRLLSWGVFMAKSSPSPPDGNTHSATGKYTLGVGHRGG